MSFAGATFSPRPAQWPHPPIWVGSSPGAVSGPAVRRCAALGDAWHPLSLSLDDIEKGHATLRDLAARSGRRHTLGPGWMTFDLPRASVPAMWARSRKLHRLSETTKKTSNRSVAGARRHSSRRDACLPAIRTYGSMDAFCIGEDLSHSSSEKRYYCFGLFVEVSG